MTRPPAADLSDPPPPGLRDLAELLPWRAARQGSQRAFVYLADGDDEQASLTYAELDARARAVGSLLRETGLRERPVLVCYPPGLDYVVALLGCLWARAVPVPAYSPDAARARRTLPRLQAIARDACAGAVLTDRASADAVQELLATAGLSALPRLIVADASTPLPDAAPSAPPDDPGEAALVIYTSGSTASPKGAVVTHANLLHNLTSFPAFPTRPCSGFVSWLPLFHDLGLLFGVLHPLYRGVPSVLMPSEAFVQRPLRWLAALARYRASASGGPNFAFELCVRATTPESRAGLDLGAWNLALNGSEPVRAETLARFTEAFAPCGFRAESFYASYGLAEATGTVSGAGAPAPPVVRGFDRRELERGRVRELPAGAPEARVLVGCGGPLAGQEIAVVDPRTRRRCAQARVGELWVHGPSVTRGYWRRPDATAETMQARLADAPERDYLRTGDLGFVRDGEVFVTGRLKDLIIVRGVNHHPEDIELTVEHSHAALRPGGGAAFAVEAEGEERLVLVHEVARLEPAQAPGVLDGMRAAVAARHELEVYALHLVRAGTIAKTSSGKIRRAQCRDDYLAGRLDSVASWLRPAEAPAEPSPRPSGARPSFAALQSWLLERATARLGPSAPAPDPRRPFSDYGLGSLDAVRLVADLEAWLGRPLSPTLVWDFPSAAALARHLAPEGGGATRAARATARADEPVAIVGMSCRFPGADTLDGFWRLLRDGVESIGETPRERWNADALYDPDSSAPGKVVSRRGGFLSGLDLFDAAFFGISPREAVHVDPRQRLLLELAWEALEDAGLPVERLAGGPVAVMVAALSNDYDRLVFGDLTRVDAYSGPGTANSLLANRLSYAFDLWGPSVTVDTACSGSLVAIHLACQSLRSGESRVALAGGVGVNLLPGGNVFFSRAGALSPDGRCHPFDARANGIVRSEGAGLLVLKPLSEARRDGDRVYALILGSALNHDGRSNGVMAPNGQAQIEMLHAAYRAAGVAPERVHYVEAHGTGTALGDVIEAQSIGAVLGAQEREHDCLLGSVKGNLGHLEPTAGVAGVIKVALAMHRRTLPASLHFEHPNPLVPFTRLRLKVQARTGPWPAPETTPLLAGVSSFGFGGTNGHVVMGSAPDERVPAARTSPGADEREPAIVPLSARTPAALAELVGRYREWLAAPGAGVSAADVGFSAATGRAHFAHRAAFVGTAPAELSERMQAFSARESPRRAARPRLVYVFSGQGSHWPRMGLALVEHEPVFRARLEDCEARLRALAGWSLLDALAGGEQALDATDIAQPAIFSLQVALAALWRHWGLAPDVIVGQSLGEAAAACVAGALTLDDALRVVVERSRLMKTLAGQGGTAVVGLSLERTRLELAACGGALDVAGLSAPETTVVSGETGALERLLAELSRRGVWARPLRGVDVALHGRGMGPLAEQLVQRLEGLRPRPTEVPLALALTGTLVEGEQLDATWWGRNLREPFQLAALVEQLLAGAGPTLLLESSPHPLLLEPLRQTAASVRAEARVLGSLRRGRPERESLLTSLAELYASGRDVAWDAVYGRRGRRVSLPHYPWQRERYWIDQLPGSGASWNDAPAADEAPAHALLGRHIPVAGPAGTHLWEQRVLPSLPRYLADHRVLGRVVFPAAAYLEMAWAAHAALRAGAAPPVLEQVQLSRALVLGGEQPPRVQAVLEPAGRGGHALRVFSATGGPPAGWVLHATLAVTAAAGGGARPARVALEAWRGDCAEEVSGARHYQAMEYRGLQYGPAFHAIERIWRRDGAAVARLRLPATLEHQARAAGLHPVLLDAAFQAVAAATPAGAEVDTRAPHLPVGIERVQLHRSGATTRLWCRAVLRPAEADAATFTADVVACTEDGEPVLEVQGLHLRRVGADTPAASDDPQSALFEPLWLARACADGHPSPDRGGRWAVLADRSGVGAALAELLQQRGEVCTLIPAPQGTPDTVTGELSRALEEALSPAAPRRGVVHLWALDDGAAPVTARALERGFALVRTAQALLRSDGASQAPSPRLWLVTRGAQAVDAQGVADVAQAQLWGLGRGLAAEHPELWGAAIDLDPETDVAAAAQQLAEELWGGDVEDRVAYRAGRRHVARLVRARLRPDASGFTPRADASYLITGGLGGLGLELARGLVERGARRLVLVGATPLPPRATWARLDPRARGFERVQAVRALEAAGASVHTAAVDVSDSERLGAFLGAYADEGWPRIRGVFHAAGVLHGQLLLRLEPRVWLDVLRPKVLGAWSLHEWFADDDALDVFVLFSSLAAITGARGEAAYAAGNAFLDALAHHRRARGLPALSVNWGPWSRVGMAARAPLLERFAREGVQALAPADALELLWRLLGEDGGQFVAGRVDWARWQEAQPRRMPLVADLIEPRATGAASATAAGAGSALLRLRASAPGERRARVEAYLTEVVARVLRMDPARLDTQRSLTDAGVDSIMSTEISAHIEAELGAKLPVVDLVMGHSVSRMAAAVLAQLGVDDGGGAQSAREAE